MNTPQKITLADARAMAELTDSLNSAREFVGCKSRSCRFFPHGSSNMAECQCHLADVSLSVIARVFRAAVRVHVMSAEMAREG